MELRFTSTLKPSTEGKAHSGSERGGPLQTAAYEKLVVLVNPLEQMCVQYGVSPSSITLASLVLALLSGACAAMGMLVTAGLGYLLAGLLDLLDGRVARLTGTACPRGAALDSIVDRFAEAFLVGGLAWNLRASIGGALCYGFIVASMGVSYARARGEGLGVKVSTGAMARGPRVALLAGSMCAEGIWGGAAGGHPSLPFLCGLAILLLATSITAYRRIIAVLRLLPGPQRLLPSADEAQASPRPAQELRFFN